VKLRLKLSLDMDITNITTSSASASPTSSVTRSLSRTSVKSAMRNMMLLLIPLILRNARTSSPLTARKHLNRFITALQLLVMTHRLCLMDILDMDMESVMLMQRLNLDTPLDLCARTRRTDSATRSLFKTPARFPAQSAKQLLTQPTLRSVRKPSPPSATQITHRFTIALLLLVMTLRLLPILMVDMVDMDTKSVKLRLSLKQRLKLSQDMDTQVDLSAMLRRTGNATRSQFRALTRSPDKSVSKYQERNATQLRLRFPDKSAITLVMEFSMSLIMAMDMVMGAKKLKHLPNLYPQKHFHIK